MKKSHLNALGKVFASEIDQAMKPAGIPRFPFQSKTKVFAELEGMGLVRREVVTLPGRPPLEVSGWTLTESGRFAYCSECKDEGDA